jgi:hypothetical protein
MYEKVERTDMEENVDPMKRAPKVVLTEGNSDKGAALTMVDDRGESAGRGPP